MAVEKAIVLQFDRVFMTGYTRKIPAATGNEFWVYKAPSVRDEIEMRQKLNQIPEAERRYFYHYMLWELAYTFKACGFPSADSPTEDPTKEGFIPVVMPGTADLVYEQLANLPLGFVQYLWEGVKKVVPAWGPQLATQTVEDEDADSADTF